MNKTIIIFVKAPRAGSVKTRLGAGVGVGRATALCRVMTERTIFEARKTDARVILAVDPVSVIATPPACWPPEVPRVGQGAGNLGDRMTRLMRAIPDGPVVIIGMDAPAMRSDHLRRAFNALGANDAVFGPADDGGYWLVGFARRKGWNPNFSDVRWSTAYAMGDTINALPKSFCVGQIDMLHDVDEADDLRHLGARALAREPF